MDALGNLVRFLLLPGQAHDMKGVAPLIKGVSFDALLADKAIDADWLLQDLDERGATAVIPPKTNRKIQRNYDAEVYKWRHLVGKFATNASGAIWWPKLKQMLIALHIGQICNRCNLAGEITQVLDPIPWVRCASGNVC